METNLSPALAAMVAVLVMPHQYSQLVSKTLLSVNDRCTGHLVHETEK